MGTSPSTVQRSGEKGLPSLCPFLRVRKTSDDDPLQPSTPIKIFLDHLLGWSCIPCPFLNPSLQGYAAHFPHTPQACSPELTREVHRAFAHAFPLELESFPDFSILFFSCSVESDSCDSMDAFFHLEKLYSKATPKNPLPPVGWVGGSPLCSHSLLTQPSMTCFCSLSRGQGQFLFNSTHPVLSTEMPQGLMGRASGGEAGLSSSPSAQPCISDSPGWTSDISERRPLPSPRWGHP